MLKYIAIILTVILFVSCASTKSDSDKLPCLSKRGNSFKVRWGEYTVASESYIGYQLDVYGDLSLYMKTSKDAPANIEKIVTLDRKDACSTLELANKTIIKTQALFAPGEKSHFVQYEVPEENVFIMAVWNTKFQTVGSLQYRILFDSLNALVPSAKYLKK